MLTLNKWSPGFAQLYVGEKREGGRIPVKYILREADPTLGKSFTMALETFSTPEATRSGMGTVLVFDLDGALIAKMDEKPMTRGMSFTYQADTLLFPKR